MTTNETDDHVRDMDRIAGLMDGADGAALRYSRDAIDCDNEPSRVLAYRAQRVANHLAGLYQALDEEFGA